MKPATCHTRSQNFTINILGTGVMSHGSKCYSHKIFKGQAIVKCLTYVRDIL